MPARDGDAYLKGLRASKRELWMGAERVDDVLKQPKLRAGALSMGVVGRTPPYMNVTFAGFADDQVRWAGADSSNAEGHGHRRPPRPKLSHSTVPDAVDLWRARYLALILLLALGLSACSPPDPGRVIQALALDPDGQLVEIDANGGPLFSGSPTELSEAGQATEVCLDDGTCVRLVDQRQIAESTDGWETSKVVWSISPTDTWWGHEYDDGYNPMVIGLYDIVVLPDQTVAVASGQLPLIERSVDGKWTPTVATLQTLPRFSLFFAIVAAVVVSAVGLAFGASHSGTGAARVALATIAPLFLIGTLLTLLAVTGLELSLFGVFLLPLGLTSAGLFIGSILRARTNDGFISAYARRIFGSSAVAFVSWIGAYALWAEGVIAWNSALGFWVVSFVVGAALACRQSAAERQALRARLPEHPVSLAGTVALSLLLTYAGIFGATALAAMGLPGGAGAQSVQVTVLTLGLIGGVIWFTARRTLHATETRPSLR